MWSRNSDVPPARHGASCIACTLGLMISQDSLAEIDLCALMPNAPAWLLLPVVHNVPNGYKRSTIAIPSCHACLGDHERKATIPYWRVDWVLALVTLCPDIVIFPPNTVITVCSACYQWWHTHSMADLLSAARRAFRLRHCRASSCPKPLLRSP